MNDVPPPITVDVDHLDISTKHFVLSDKHLTEDLDELTLILKSHLLIEELLRDYCAHSIGHPKYLSEARLTFKQIFCLARSIYTLNLPSMDWTWGTVISLNTMRNLMAHAIEPDETKYAKARDMIINEVMSNASQARPKPPTFHGAVAYLYGAFGALLQGHLILKAGGTVDQIPRPPDDSAQPSDA